MAMRHVGLSLVGSIALSLLAQSAWAGLPNCEPGTVLKAATGERQAMVLRALNFYSYYPDYSQSTCLNVRTGAKTGTDFNQWYGGCDAGSDSWRTDCSGFASFVWDVAKNYACGALGTGGNDGDGHSWSSKSMNALEPGDAINNPAEHVMVFTGWMDDAHTKMCTIQELNPTQYDMDGVVGCGSWSWDRSALEGVYTPLGLNDTSRFNPTPAQSSANDTIALVNWPDGHAEAFVRTAGQGLAHTYSGGGDSWSMPEVLDSDVACGASVNYWPHIQKWASAAEVFCPRSAGGAGHLWWSGGNWNKLNAFGTQTLSHFQSVAHFDGNLEVFALGADGAIYSNFGDRWASKWSDWQSLGGSFKTGASAIVWNDGHTELFATGKDGTPSHNWTANGKWNGWTAMDGALLSRPVPVRWADGHVEVFATGANHKLQHSSIQKGAWSTFADVDAMTDIAGDPSPIMNVGGGASAGPEVFARSLEGKVVHLWWDGSKYTAFSPHMDQTTASDPMGWVRRDGTAEVFAVDTQGDLVHSKHDGGGWSMWSSIGGGVDACAATVIDSDPPPTPATSSSAGAGGASATGAGGSMSTTGSAGAQPEPESGDDGGCSVPAGGRSSFFGAIAIALAALAARSRRRAR